MSGTDPHHKTEHSQHSQVIDRSWAAWLRGQILGEEPISCAGGDQKEEWLFKEKPQSQSSSEQNDSLGLAQCCGSLSSIEHPNWDQVENIQPRACSRERCPEWIPCTPPNHQASDRRYQPGQRPGQTNCSARLE